MDITQVADRLSQALAKGTRVPGTQRFILEKPLLEGILEDLKNSIPQESKEAGEIIRQRESIINQANMEAERIRHTAQEESEALRSTAETEYKTKVSDTEITKHAEKKGEGIVRDAQRSAESLLQDAQRRAQRIMDDSQAMAESRKSGADRYSREALFNLEEKLSELLTQVRKGLDVLGTANTASKSR